MILKSFLSICLIFTVYNVDAQNVKLKKDVIYVDGTAAFSFDWRMSRTEMVVYTLNTKDELLTGIIYSGSRDTQDDDYTKLVFTPLGKSMEFTRGYWGKRMIQWLVEQGVLTSEGTMDIDKVDDFVLKYDENVSGRSILQR